MKIKYILIFILTFSTYAHVLSSLKLSDTLLNSLGTTSADTGDIRYYSDVYSQILREYENTYQTLGDRYAKSALKNGVFGGTNMIGWRHANDFSSFKVLFNRSIAPNLFSDEGYIVNDEMIIEIDISKFIKKMANDDNIKITDQNLLAFGGLIFKRTFRYNHFAQTLEDGLQTKFDHLFFIFKYFKTQNFNKLSEYDYITKEDSLTLSTGALGTAPVVDYVSVGAGLFLSTIKKSKVTIQKLGRDDEKQPDESLRVTSEDETTVSAGANITVLVDIFKLLQMTLFSYDFEYSFSKKFKVYMSLFNTDLVNETKMQNVEKILSFKSFDNSLFANNLTSKETRQKEIKTSKYLAFIWGGVKKSSTEMIEILKSETIYRFFNHHYEKLSYKENLLSKVMVAVLGKLIGFEQLAARTQTKLYEVNINYEAEVNIIDSKADFNIFDDNILSIDMAYRERIEQDSKKKKTELVSLLRDAVSSRSRQLAFYSNYIDLPSFRAPWEFQSSISVDNKGIEYFMKKNINDVFDIFKKMCKSKRSGPFSFLSNLYNPCQTKLNIAYNNFLKEWTTLNYSAAVYESCSKKYRFSLFMSKQKKLSLIEKCMEITNKLDDDYRGRNFPLWRFKDVATNINNYARDLSDFESFFGVLSNKGQIILNYSNGISYKNYFREGELKGNILTQFQIDNNLRAPASLEN